MKTIIDIRTFAVEQAVKILGAGTPDKAVVAKAKEIESYITNGQDIPEEDTTSLSDVIGIVGALLTPYLGSDKKDAPESEKQTNAKKG